MRQQRRWQLQLTEESAKVADAVRSCRWCSNNERKRAAGGGSSDERKKAAGGAAMSARELQ